MRDFGNLFEVCAHRHRATRPRPITLGCVAIVYIACQNTFFANKFRFAMSVRSPQACGLTPPNTPLRVGPAKRLACVAVDSDEESVCCTQQVNTQPFEDDDDEVEKPTVSLPATPTTVGTIAPAYPRTTSLDAHYRDIDKNNALLISELRRIAKNAKYAAAKNDSSPHPEMLWEATKGDYIKAFHKMASLLDGTTEVGQVDN